MSGDIFPTRDASGIGSLKSLLGAKKSSEQADAPHGAAKTSPEPVPIVLAKKSYDTDHAESIAYAQKLRPSQRLNAMGVKNDERTAYEKESTVPTMKEIIELENQVIRAVNRSSFTATTVGSPMDEMERLNAKLAAKVVAVAEARELPLTPWSSLQPDAFIDKNKTSLRELAETSVREWVDVASKKSQETTVTKLVTVEKAPAR